MKRIAIFADGTWNSPEQDDPTNVLRFSRAIKPQVGKTEQIAFYDWGVGTDRKKMSGGLSGAGIDKNIVDCYRFLIHNYHPGDQLFFFGFSRGAYTVRSLAGFIRNSGLLKREHADKIDAAFKLYRKRNRASGPNAAQAISFRQRFAVADITPIEFMGVWDTVGALGIPVPFWGTLGEADFLFHDTEPSKIVLHARHAVSIDENRADFEPTLWDAKPGLDLKQVWFAGVHSDVGGGYADCGLGDCAGEWMMKEAKKFGLVFEPHLNTRLKPKPHAVQHNERKGIFKVRHEFIRAVNGPVHESVKRRWMNDSHQYRTRSKAMRQLLKSLNNDWSKIKVVK